MSLIQYREASYAGQLREQLEQAGCESKIAALVSRTVGELIDHVTQAQEDLRREVNNQQFELSMRRREIDVAKGEVLQRLAGITLFVLAASLVVGILVALFR
ncbi:hypothetical protein [Methylibium rhizosphaerae]|uniref:hypothetical protein n=1 Tax=Methylibium rhizosphaerae TaxID=2570323 RepID=UPI00112DF18B|nr:hypothetical protein [Methylibium rhizosphaerae]